MAGVDGLQSTFSTSKAALGPWAGSDTVEKHPHITECTVPSTAPSAAEGWAGTPLPHTDTAGLSTDHFQNSHTGTFQTTQKSHSKS